MTSTTTITRLYALGNRLDDDHRTPMDEQCGIGHGGYVCSLRNGHTGPQHVAAYPTGQVCHVWDRDTSGDDVDTDALRRQVGELTARLAMRDQELARVRRERDEADERMVEFRRQVGQVAMRYARAHDWCSVVQQALNELGITVTQEYRVRTDVWASYGDWEAKRESVYVNVESKRERGQVYRDVDEMDGDDAINALKAAGIELPEGFEFSRFDASTSDVEPIED